MDIKIATVAPKRNGIDGLVVTFEKREKAKDGLTYNNEYDGKFKMPVPNSLRQKWNELTPYVIKLLCLNPKLPPDSILYNSISCNAAGEIKLSVRVLSRHNKWYTTNVPVVVSDEEFDGYTKMYDIVDEVFSLSARYILKSETETPKQTMLNLIEDAEVRHKDFGYTKEDIENMATPEIMDIYVKLMEERGAIFLEKPSA